MSFTRDPQRSIRRTATFLAETSALDCPCAYVAQDVTGRLVGAIVAALKFGNPWVHALGVVADRRLEYIGYDLKLEVVGFYRDLGHEKVFSSVHRQNVPMRALNEKLAAQNDPFPGDEKYLLSAVYVEPVAQESVSPS